MLQKKKDTMQRTQTTVDGPVTGTLSQIVHDKFHIRILVTKMFIPFNLDVKVSGQKLQR
jgi:hypothetical protein